MRKLWILPITFLPLLAGALAAGTETHELAAASGERITFDLDTGGDVVVTGWDRESASIETITSGRDADRVTVSVTRTAGGIKVSSPSLHGRGRHLGVRVEARVPRRYDVELETMGGDVELTGLEGSFRGETMGGDVVLADLHGEAQVSTMGGDIRVRDSTLDGKVTTMGGDVSFDNVDGNLDGSTMGGDVVQRNVRRSAAGAEAVQISSHGGDVRVDEAPAGANVKTMGGDIHIRTAGSFLKAHTMGGDVRVDRARGETDLTTMGGDVSVGDFDGSIKALTMGGDIDVQVVGTGEPGSHDVELRSMSGDLTLGLPAGFSGRFEIELVKFRRDESKARIESDFPLDIDEPADWIPAGERSRGDRSYGDAHKLIRATGTVGGGNHWVRLETINGVVRLKRR